MARETWVQSQVESYQRLKKWYLMPPCLTLNIIIYRSSVTWFNPRNGLAPFHTPCFSKYRKGSLRPTLDYGRQLWNNRNKITSDGMLSQEDWKFSGHSNSIPNIIRLLKKEKCIPNPCPWGYNNYVDAHFQTSREDVALEVTASSVKSTNLTC